MNKGAMINSLLRQGMSYADIVSNTGSTLASVQSYASRGGLTRNKSASGGESKKDVVLRVLRSGGTYRDAAAQSGCSINSARWYASKAGISDVRRECVTKEDTRGCLILKMLKSGSSYGDIARATDSSINSVRWHASKNGLTSGKSRKAKNEDAPRRVKRKAKCPNVNDEIQCLAESVSAGDSSNMDDLMRIIMPRLRYYIGGFFKSSAMVDDVLSAVMERILVGFDKYNPDYRFTTWMYSVAKYESLLQKDGGRWKKKVTLVDEYRDCDCGFDDDIDDAFSERLDFGELYSSVLDLIESLPDDVNKEIFIDMRINKMRGKDISEKYDIPVNTVKTKVRKMTLQVRKMIESKIPCVNDAIII